MVVCIDYTQDGARTISNIAYQADRTEESLINIANAYKNYHDEVFTVNFDPNSQDFITEILKSGCRM